MCLLLTISFWFSSWACSLGPTFIFHLPSNSRLWLHLHKFWFKWSELCLGMSTFSVASNMQLALRTSILCCLLGYFIHSHSVIYYADDSHMYITSSNLTWFSLEQENACLSSLLGWSQHANTELITHQVSFTSYLIYFLPRILEAIIVLALPFLLYSSVQQSWHFVL